MGLGDFYVTAPWTPYSDVRNRMDTGMDQLAKVPERNAGLAAQQQANVDAAYNSPARQATPHEAGIGGYIQKMMDGPPEFQRRLSQELTSGGLDRSSAYPEAGAAGPMDINRAMPPSGPGYAIQPPRPDSDQVNYLSGAASSPYGGDLTGLQRPPQAAPPAPAQAQPQVQARPNLGPMTRGDVEMYARMGPFIANETRERIASNRPPPLTYEQRLGLIQEKGNQARQTEGVRSQGRIDAQSIRLAQQKLIKGAEIALQYKQLDETTARHIDQFNTDLAKLQQLSQYQDRLMDWRKSGGSDPLLNNMTRLMGSMMSSRANLIGSGFGRTPEGAEALQAIDDALIGPAQILQDYEQGRRQVPTSAPGEGQTQSTTQTERKPGPLPQMTPRSGGTGRLVPKGRPNGPFKFRLKVDTSFGKKGQTGQSTDPKDFDPSTMEIIQ